MKVNAVSYTLAGVAAEAKIHNMHKKNTPTLIVFTCIVSDYAIGHRVGRKK